LTLTRSTAREFAANRVRVNAIAPAGVRTDRIQKLLEQSEAAQATMARQIRVTQTVVVIGPFTGPPEQAARTPRGLFTHP
jgi:NAD(P)-dependent dehydrogenase (short-subunit alcohol dehydrogenase family)